LQLVALVKSMEREISWAVYAISDP
jgi:hypothetical protein